MSMRDYLNLLAKSRERLSPVSNYRVQDQRVPTKGEDGSNGPEAVDWNKPQKLE